MSILFQLLQRAPRSEAPRKVSGRPRQSSPRGKSPRSRLHDDWKMIL